MLRYVLLIRYIFGRAVVNPLYIDNILLYLASNVPSIEHLLEIEAKYSVIIFAIMVEIEYIYIYLDKIKNCLCLDINFSCYNNNVT